MALALRIDAPDWTLGHFIVAATGALGGRNDLASRAYKRLVELNGEDEPPLRDALQRWRVEPVLAGEIERGIAAAAAAQR